MRAALSVRELEAVQAEIHEDTGNAQIQLATTGSMLLDGVTIHITSRDEPRRAAVMLRQLSDAALKVAEWLESRP